MEVTPQDINQIRKEVSEVRESQEDMKSKVDQMYYALVGNALGGDGGLVERIRRIENRQDKQDDKMEQMDKNIDKGSFKTQLMWGGVIVAASAVIAYVIQLIFHK